MTTVVNVKVQFIRPEYKNLAEWQLDENNVYIGRKGVVFIGGERYPKRDSIFSNPFKIGRDGTREDVIAKYREYAANDPEIQRNLGYLKNKNLGCWCAPEACHGHVLKELADLL